ncbi:hypothetical protein AA0473_1600 [Acetobacter orleanensis NRIC 0473]|uniref:NIPSNAP domain-containing protein n=2 Tax=Acetobacter orleanensis TaxID=104099 RepID=A0A4Y3TMZ8_9PROT|nr:hypothetical protein AD949_05505 [Acetobacter orleanensis]PCD78993.1 hypothetical protein CO710_09445 [Acetobacter orleanensis]GAN67776.1 hypothetical protein Abol_011_032 [Acetobacter orleanensis JCM 7639]GBR27985.1 hypothetical protein AA0473_1600 [Acetobacter orleanensis NRIC 0473]GEB83113.1 hypothetical protein AOR01nite_15900 [Acetobacter orleanensis]
MIAALFVAIPARASDNDQHSLVISYRTAPAGRPELLSALRTQLVPRLQGLYAKDGLAHYRILFSRLVDTNTWDALVILEFRNNAQATRWQTIDTQTPAGLDVKSLTGISTVESTVSDCIGSSGPLSGTPDPVYMVIPYDYFVSPSEYVDYVHAYVEPQTNGWIKAGALNAYQIYTARYPAGRGWMSLLLLAYHGNNGLDQRNTVVAATRKALTTNAEWAARAHGKEHIRSEKAAMIADMIAGK